MRKTILMFLVGAGVAVTSVTGCRSVPADFAQTIADIDSDSRTNNAFFRRILDGYAPTAEEKAHCKARTIALDDLTPKAAKWAADNQKKE